MDEKLVSFENTYLQTSEDFKRDCPDVFGSVTIDGYPEDEDAAGAVVAEIFLTKNKDFVISWHLNMYRLNDTVKKLIEDSKTILLNAYDEAFG